MFCIFEKTNEIDRREDSYIYRCINKGCNGKAIGNPTTRICDSQFADTLDAETFDEIPCIHRENVREEFRPVGCCGALAEIQVAHCKLKNIECSPKMSNFHSGCSHCLERPKIDPSSVVT